MCKYSRPVKLESGLDSCHILVIQDFCSLADPIGVSEPYLWMQEAVFLQTGLFLKLSRFCGRDRLGYHLDLHVLYLTWFC